MKAKIKRKKRFDRQKRTRAGIQGKDKRPRLSVFRSSSHIYCQLIDDEKGKTLVSAGDKEIGKSKAGKSDLSAKQSVAWRVGELLAKKSLEKKIDKVVFDRGGYKYHGRVRALAEGARKGGLKF